MYLPSKHYEKLMEGVKAWNKWRQDELVGRPDFKNAELAEHDLTNVNLSGANLQNAIIIGANLTNANLTGADLTGAHLEGACLEGTTFIRANLSNVYLGGTYFEIGNFHRSFLSEADIIRAKHYWANVSNQRSTENANHFETVKYRKLGKCRGIKIKNCYGSPRFIRDALDNDFVEEFRERKRIIYYLWYLTCDCGRSIWRWLLWSIFLALYFGCNFFFMGADNFSIKEQLPSDFITFIYYSVVTFTTLGFGDITPISRIGEIWVMAEVIIGYIMLGGLISIFAAKLARRSS